MSFIVEDGTGKVDANSYVSVAFAKNYFLERGITTFDDLFDEDIKASLILATDYIEMRFGSQFKGLKFDADQALSFPMVSYLGEAIDKFLYDTVDPTLEIGVEIPVKVQRACCEYALRSRTTPLIKDVLSDSVVSQRVKIGQIEKETNFASNSKRPEAYNSFPSADLLLRPYLKSSSGVIRA